MTIAVSSTSRTSSTSRQPVRHALSTGAAQAVLVLVVGAAIAAGFLATGTETTLQTASHAGTDLTRLLRGMAVLKALMAAGATAAVIWRLGAAAPVPWLAAYALACAAMGAGPGLVWGMAHVGAGAVLLHGGLLAAVLLLWRDPATAARLAGLVTARRTSPRS